MSEILFKRQMLAGSDGLTLPQNICPQTDCVSFIISFYAVGFVSFHGGTSLSSVHGKYRYTSLDTLIIIYQLTIYNTCPSICIHKQPGLFKFKVCGSKDVVSHRILCKGFFPTF